MTVVLGTSGGFVTVAPTADPDGGGSPSAIDGGSRVTRDTSPSTAGKIIEVGWWCDTASEEANFEVGLYAADGATLPGEAGTLIHHSTTNAKGTDAGWKRVTVDWAISASTTYWIGLQVDSTATNTLINFESSGGAGFDIRSSVSTLPNPYGGGTLTDSDGVIALYALWEEAEVTYTLTADAGAYTLTGQNMAPIVSRLIAMGTGAYTLSGQTVGLLKTYVMAMGTGVYTLTGNALNFITTGWKYATKVVASFGDTIKNIASYGNDTKNTSNYGNETKNTATYSSPDKNTDSDNYVDKS